MHPAHHIHVLTGVGQKEGREEELHQRCVLPGPLVLGKVREEIGME
jgi:hypothetical protein